MYKIDLALATGIDIPIPECQITIHQPSIKEISYIGEENYFWALQSVCLRRTEEMPQNMNEFQIFMSIMNDKQAEEQKENICAAFSLWFPNSSLTLTPRALLLNQETNNSIIDENNFSSLQETLRHIGCLADKPEEVVNPANEAAAKIAKKLKAGREKAARLNKEKNNPNNASILGQYISILAVGLGKSMSELTNLTVYQLYDLIERFELYERFDLDIKQRLAGGKPDSQPDNWKKIIH